MVTGRDCGSSSTLTSALAPALAEVRERSPEYRRWWSRQLGRDSDSTPPWSDCDEEKVARLGAVDPWWLRSVAGELDRVRTEVHEVGAALAQIAEAAIGGPAAAVCARLAVSSHERASEAGELSVSLRDAGREVDDLVESAARRVLRTAYVQEEHAQDEPTQGEPTQSGGPVREPDRPASDDGFERYAAVLRAVRAELAAALGRLPALVLGEPEDPWSRPPAAGWMPEPGAGPLLPATTARRVEPGYGVRIARLPDVPPG
jgi:hypothetical protein